MRRPLFALMILLLTTGVIMPSDGQDRVSPSVLANGGGAVSDVGTYTMLGTIGQALIGVSDETDYASKAGFWHQISWRAAPGQDVDDDALLGSPGEFALRPGRPNPSRETILLQYAIPSRAQVAIKLYDVSGRLARTLVNGEQDPGLHDVVLESAGLDGGIYFCRMVCGEFSKTRRLVLIK